ncbi:MAG: hypothetical protein M3M85_00185 [bacterium]|nr:hypothetical protein [bacterium]
MKPGIEDLLSDVTQRKSINKEIDKLTREVREIGDRDKKLEILSEATSIALEKLKANLDNIKQALEKSKNSDQAESDTRMALDVLKDDIMRIIRNII